MGFEERFGTQWTVWVGGVALALGGFFLVRYSIEQGWFGPGMRIILGGLFALALIAAGEWARRKENLSGIGGLPAAHIPSILTAAGTAVAYADIWAAFALYNFIGAATAFVLLGIVALATLAAALMHGPALAGLGLVGAYVTPLIVSTGQANYWALYIYLAVVTAAAFVLARARMWRWLAFTAVAFGLFWTLPGLAMLDQIGSPRMPSMSSPALRWSRLHRLRLAVRSRRRARQDRCRVIGRARGLPLRRAADRADEPARHAGAHRLRRASAATVAIAWRTEAATAAVPLAAMLVALMFLQYAVNVEPRSSRAAVGADRRRDPGAAARVLRHASRARRRLRRAVRRRRLPRAGALDASRRADALGCVRGVRAARDPGRALLPHLRVRAVAAFAGLRCCWPRCSRSRPKR